MQFWPRICRRALQQHQVEFHVHNPLIWSSRIDATVTATAISIQYRLRVFSLPSELPRRTHLAIVDARRLDVDRKRHQFRRATGKSAHQPQPTSISRHQLWDDRELSVDRRRYLQVPSPSSQLFQVRRYWRTTTIHCLARGLSHCPIWARQVRMLLVCYTTTQKMLLTTIQLLSTRQNYLLRHFWM